MELPSVVRTVGQKALPLQGSVLSLKDMETLRMSQSRTDVSSAGLSPKLTFPDASPGEGEVVLSDTHLERAAFTL